MQLKVSFVKNTWDNKPKDEVLSFQDMCELFKDFKEISSKKNTPGIISGHFQERSRKTENLISKSLLILDVDFYKGSIYDLELLVKRNLDKYRYIGYSTFSHTVTTPKIRIILFFSEEVKTAEYKKISWNFIQTLEHEFQEAIEMNSSIRPNQIMYLPVRPNDKYIPWYKHQDGKLIDVDNYLYLPSFEVVSKDTDNQLLITLKNNPLDLSDEAIENYLNKYNVENTDYYEWLEVGAALHHQYNGMEQGLNIWNEWSKKDSRLNKYRGIYDLKNKWNSFNSNSTNPITFATIIYKLKKNTTPIDDCDYAPLNSQVWIDTRGKSRTPIFTEANFRILIKEYKVGIRLDEIKKQEEISFNGVLWEDLNSAKTRIKSLCELNNIKTHGLNDMINLIGHCNKFNSWKEWVCSKPWDGVKRFDKLCNSVEVNEEYITIRDLYLKKWFLQLINITCLNDEDEAKVARTILVFQGHQSANKTSWFRSLVPPKGNKFIAEAASLQTSKDMSVLKCVSHVLVELGEMKSTMKKSDTDELKSFISSTKDIINLKYLTYPSTFRRKTVFFGSVNENEFLEDQTGNTRFLCLPVINCNHLHNIDMQQLYAELLILAEKEDYKLTAEDLALQEKMNSKFKVISILEEKLLEVFEVEKYISYEKESCTKYTATGLLEELGFNINQMVHKKNLVNEMAKILDSYAIKRCTNPRGWYIPPKKLQDHGF